MSKDETRSIAIVPYEVGYGKPPVAKRFKPGTSGNPTGRPRGSKNARPSPISADRAKTLLLEEAYRPVTLREGDRVVELPAIQAVFRAMGVAAMKGNRFAQATLAEIVGKVEAEQTATKTEHFTQMVEYKIRWEREIERCRAVGRPEPEPLPHPDDIFIDARNCTVQIAGPLTPQEKAWVDHTVALLKVLQVQVSRCAAAARRARSKERREGYLDELHDCQRHFDQMNDVLAPRYQRELRDRSHHPEASRPGDHAAKLGIKLPGPQPPKPLPRELLELLEGR